jgi:hypothetical protein
MARGNLDRKLEEIFATEEVVEAYLRARCLKR